MLLSTGPLALVTVSLLVFICLLTRNLDAFLLLISRFHSVPVEGKTPVKKSFNSNPLVNKHGEMGAPSYKENGTRTRKDPGCEFHLI